MNKLGEPLSTMVDIVQDLDSSNSKLEQQTQYLQQQIENTEDTEKREALEKIAHNLEELERRYKQIFTEIDEVRMGMEESK